MNTVLGLLAKGNMNCAGNEIGTDLFSNTADNVLVADEQHKAPRNPNETVGTGVVLTAAEKQKAEEEANRKKETGRGRGKTSWQRKKQKKKQKKEKRTASSIR